MVKINKIWLLQRLVFFCMLMALLADCQFEEACLENIQKIFGENALDLNDFRCEKTLGDPMFNTPQVIYFTFKYQPITFNQFLKRPNLYGYASKNGQSIVLQTEQIWGRKLDEKSLCAKIYANLDDTPRWWKPPANGQFEYIGYVHVITQKYDDLLRIYHDDHNVYGVIDVTIK